MGSARETSRRTLDSVCLTTEAASLSAGSVILSIGLLCSKGEAFYPPSEGLISNLESSGFESGIPWFEIEIHWIPVKIFHFGTRTQWIRVLNPLDRNRNPLDSDLEFSGFEVESQCFEG
jgi:hypothetical protein